MRPDGGHVWEEIARDGVAIFGASLDELRDMAVQAKRIVGVAIDTVGALQQDAAMCVRAKPAARA